MNTFKTACIDTDNQQWCAMSPLMDADDLAFTLNS